MSVENMLAQKAIPLSSRRALLKRLLRVGMVGSASFSTLTSCNSLKQSPITINWITNVDHWNTFKNLATSFSKINQAAITVNAIPRTDYDTLVGLFEKQDTTYDLVSLDVTWMREFITKHWLVSLDDYWPENDAQLKRSDYLQTPLKICSSREQLWAAPLHTDVGILYYRTRDRQNNPIPLYNANALTWEDLARMAQQAQENHGFSDGFLWEGYWSTSQPAKEGLMCLFLEILDGFDGQLFDSADNPQKVLINSTQAINALEHMRKWNTTISEYITDKRQKKKASDNNDSDCAKVWKNGEAVFMRNWPSFITDSDNAKNAVAEKYDIAPLPQRVLTSAGQQSAGTTRSCLGGWQLAINRYSPKSHQDAAWQFIKWMLSAEVQQYLASNESFAVTLESVYNDPHINALNPHYKLLRQIIENAQYRPLLPNYLQDVAIPVQRIVSRVLTDDGYTPQQAVQDLQLQLEKALQKKV